MYNYIHLLYIYIYTYIYVEDKHYWRRLITEGLGIRKLGGDEANLQVGHEMHECSVGIHYWTKFKLDFNSRRQFC